MVEFYRSLKAAELWIYLAIGIIAIVPFKNIVTAIKEYRATVFGMEKTVAREKLVQQGGFLLILLLIVAGEFVFVSFAGAAIPALALIPTPTANLSATETLPATLQTTSQPVMANGTELTPTLGDAGGSPGGGCIPGQIEWTSPVGGAEVSGIVELKGTANIPNFAMYYFEVSKDNSTWNKLSAERVPVSNGVLGNWNTATELPGDYTLRLIVTDNAGAELAPCLLQVKLIQK